jgi:hypothetical protein
VRHALGARLRANSRGVLGGGLCVSGGSRPEWDGLEWSGGFRRRDPAGGPIAGASQRHRQDHAEENQKNEESGTDGWAGHCPAGYSIPVVVSTTVALYVPAF